MPRKPARPPMVCQYFTWNLFRRNGVHYADARGGKYKLGKHSLGTRDHDEAIERLKSLDVHKAIQLGLATPEAAKPTATVTISYGWQAFIDHCGRSPVLGGVSAIAQKRYRTVRDKHTEFCDRHGIATWNTFDKAALEKYCNSLTKKFADRTVYFELTLVKSVILWLIQDKKLPAAAKIDYALTKPEGTDTYCYTREEVAAMVMHCRASPQLGWLADMITALAHLGVRISELVGLRWTDIDLENNVITVPDERGSHRKRLAGMVRTTKGKRSRNIPIHPRLRETLLKMDRGTDGRVFHTNRGKPIHKQYILELFVGNVIKPLKETFPTPQGEIGFEHGRMHSFRHFFVSQCFLGGASEGEIREWVGHADSKMVEHYRHLGQKDALRRMEQISFVDSGANEQGRSGQQNKPAQNLDAGVCNGAGQ